MEKRGKQSKVCIRNSGANRQKRNPCGANTKRRESLKRVLRRCTDSCESFAITPAWPIYKPDICIRCREIPRWNLSSGERSVLLRSRCCCFGFSCVSRANLTQQVSALCARLCFTKPARCAWRSPALASLSPPLIQGFHIVLSYIRERDSPFHQP